MNKILFGLRTTYLSKNCFIEMPRETKNENFKNYAFTTIPEHVCNKLNVITFQGMRLKVKEARRSVNSFNEKRNITNSSFERKVKRTANTYSPNRFEFLICETTENDEKDQP